MLCPYAPKKEVVEAEGWRDICFHYLRGKITNVPEDHANAFLDILHERAMCGGFTMDDGPTNVGLKAASLGFLLNSMQANALSAYLNKTFGDRWQPSDLEAELQKHNWKTIED